MALDGRLVYIFDTTLRDGIQAPRNIIPDDQKIDIAKSIDKTGVAYIEVGFPASSPEEFNFVSSVVEHISKAKPVGFSRSLASDIDCVADSMGVDSIQLQLLFVGSELHSKHKRGWANTDNVFKEISEATGYARSLGFTDISAGLEDSSRASEAFLLDVAHHSVSCGCSTIVLADTVGCLIPSEAYKSVKLLRNSFPEDVKISAHFHNDMGLACGNAVAAIEAGADIIQTTFCGIGERTGNVPIEEILSVIYYKFHHMLEEQDICMKNIVDVCFRVIRAIKGELWRHKPILGENAFSTAAGVHASGVLRDPITYEYVEPHIFGRERNVLLSRMSGRANIKYILDKKNVAYDPGLLDTLYKSLLKQKNPIEFNDEDKFQWLFQQCREVEAKNEKR